MSLANLTGKYNKITLWDKQWERDCALYVYLYVHVWGPKMDKGYNGIMSIRLTY